MPGGGTDRNGAGSSVAWDNNAAWSVPCDRPGGADVDKLPQ